MNAGSSVISNRQVNGSQNDFFDDFRGVDSSGLLPKYLTLPRLGDCRVP